jgi:hypothetical protein
VLAVVFHLAFVDVFLLEEEGLCRGPIVVDGFGSTYPLVDDFGGCFILPLFNKV